MDDAIRRLRSLLSGRPLVWMGSSSHYVQPTIRHVAARAQLFCTSPLRTPLDQTEYVALEDDLDIRPDWNEFAEADIFRCHRVAFEHCLDGLEEAYVLPYWVTEPLQEKIVAFGHRLLGNPGRIVDYLDRRNVGRALAADCGLDTIPVACHGVEANPDFNTMCERWSAKRLVIAAPLSVGGAWIHPVADQETLGAAVSRISDAFPDETVEVAPFVEGLPLNLNVAVMPHGHNRCAVVVYPVSIQLIGTPGLSDGRMRYCGCDFAAAKRISGEEMQRLEALAYRMGHLLYERFGWRGFFGLDLILASDGRLIFVELNPRLQSSTHLLDKHFRDRWNPLVMQVAAFLSPGHVGIDTSLVGRAPDRAFAVMHNGSGGFLKLANTSGTHPDTYGFPTIGKDVAPGGILLRRAFEGPIVATSGELVPGVLDAMKADVLMAYQPSYAPTRTLPAPFPQTVTGLSSLKAQLMAEGIRLAAPLDNRPFYSVVTEGVDICLEANLTVNAPVREGAKAILYHDGREGAVRLNGRTFPARLYPVPPTLSEPFGNAGETIADYCAIATDRVNVWAIENCVLGFGSKACRFCDVVQGLSYRRKRLDLASGALDRLLADPAVRARHIQLTGGTPRGKDWEHFLDICRVALSKERPVSVMTTLWTPDWVLEEMRNAGVTELSLNIEFASQDARDRFTPGKADRRIWRRLKQVVAVWPRATIRSALLVGPEPVTDTIEGARRLLDMGILPVLSPFRPAPGTDMAHLLPPDAVTLHRAFMETANHAVRVGLFVGPACNAGQHNVMALPIGLYAEGFSGLDQAPVIKADRPIPLRVGPERQS